MAAAWTRHHGEVSNPAVDNPAFSNPAVDNPAVTSTAVLVLGFGGPDGPDDVMPFLRTVTRGRNVPDDRLATVAEQYRQFGGCSPINNQNRALVEALQKELTGAGHNLTVYWGNRNWHPFLGDTVAEMANDGITDALVFATSAFGSYSGCRQYREDLALAAQNFGPGAPTLQKLRLFYNHPGFIGSLAANLRATLDGIRDQTHRPDHPARPSDNDDATAEALDPDTNTRLVFTAHSIPTSMAAGCDYAAQLNEAAGLVAAAAGWGDGEWDLAYQSRSGPPSVPWLEPDINDHLHHLQAQGFAQIVVVPLGFISDHMEVLFDLDTQAQARADQLGMTMHRVPTVGTAPRFVTMIRQLIEEQLPGHNGLRLALGSQGPWPDECPAGHCPAPRRPGR